MRTTATPAASGGLVRRLVGIIGSGMIGRDPFSRDAWSGISYQVFSRLRDQGCLHRAFGVEVPEFRKLLLRLRFAHPNRQLWRHHYYMSRSYRDSLTDAIGLRLRPDDFDQDFFILGAMYDVPRLVAGRSLCFSYHDGNLAQQLKSPYRLKNLSTKRIEEGLSFERRVYEKTDRILAMSEYLRRSFIEDYGIAPSRVAVIGAGVNMDIPDPFPDKRYDTKQILFIGQDFTRKGGPLLLKAFRQVLVAHPDARLHIVGPRQIDWSGESTNGIVYHGFLDKSSPADAAKLKELFRGSSLFVLPSLYEPFGIAPLEAMVHQIPAVVSRAWALEEIVAEGVTGEHVEPGSADDLIDRLRTLLANPDLLEKMGNAARASVLARYTWPRVVSRIVAEIAAVQQQQAGEKEVPSSDLQCNDSKL
jgi:alpha-maltose-1-phosphate synthase